MAYPSFFPPIQISGARGVPGNTYLGSLFQSNPSFTALSEAKHLWNSKIADIGVLLSLGGACTASRMFLPNNASLSGLLSDLSSLLNALASTAAAIERTHRHIEILFNEASTRQEQAYFRLDPGNALADVPYLMTALAIERIRGITANSLQNPQTYAAVKACAKALTELERGKIIGQAMATGVAAKLTVEEHAELQQSLRVLRESLGDEIVITSSHQETLQRRLAIVEAAVLQLKADENAQSSLWKEWRTEDTAG